MIKNQRTGKGLYNNLPTRAENCYCAFLFGNINIYSVHLHKDVTRSFVVQLVSASFTHCPFNLLRCDTNAPEEWLNLHKTNRANEELVSRLLYGHEVWGRPAIPIAPALYSLSNKMDNFLLAVRGVNHKYIVVGGNKRMEYAEKGNGKETVKNMLWLFKYIPHIKFFLFLGMYIIKAILEFMVPAEVGKIIDNVIVGNGTLSYIQTFIFLVVVNVIMDMLSNILLVDVQSKPTMKIQEEMIKHLFVLGIPYYENSEKGKVFSLFNTMISNVKNIYQNILPIALKNMAMSQQTVDK